jgi:hypothetical protein
MRILRLVPVCLLFLFLSSQTLLPLSHATHFPKLCCSCQNPCKLGCVCRGSNPYHCLPCRTSFTPVTVDSLIHLTKVGECARRSFAARILVGIAEDLKVESFHLSEGDEHDSPVVLQVAAHTER